MRNLEKEYHEELSSKSERMLGEMIAAEFLAEEATAAYELVLSELLDLEKRMEEQDGQFD